MRRILVFFSVLCLLLASCGRNSGGIDTEPDVAITRIYSAELSTQQTSESGGSGSIGGDSDTTGLIRPGAGPIVVAASNLYDPITGQTTENPLSVYVVASDESNVERVELFQDSAPVGARSKAEDGAAFKNPFIFPKPGDGQTSVSLQGSPSGMLSTQLRVVATDSSGQVKESAPLELQIDGSRPLFNFSVTGDGPPYSTTDLITVTGSASDLETGISSFDVTLNGVTIEADASNSFSVSQTLNAGVQTLLLTAVNGVMVPNQLTYTFLVEEAIPDNGELDNLPPVVNLMATPRDTDPLIVDFTASASDPENDGLTYTYDFGDGTTEDGAPSASHTYAEAGTYTAMVTVADGKGGTAVDSIVIPLGQGDDNENGPDNGAPSVSLEATPTSGSAPLTVNLTATATDPDGDTLTYTWNFGNGETTTGDSSQSVTYSEDGTYTVVVTVDDGKGGTVSATTIVTVGTDDGDGDNGDNGGSQDPAVSIDGNEARTFTVGEAQDLAAAVSNLGDNVTYQWSATTGTAENVSFGDATAEATTVTFSAAGSYTLTLTASDGANTVTDTVTFTEAAGNDGNGNGGDNGGNDGDNDNGGVDAVNDSAKTTRGKAVTIKVLTNDKPSAQALSIVAVTSPKKGGTVEISRDSRTIVYTPPGGFTGTDSFRYTVKDEDGNSAAANVKVEVNR